MLAALAGSVEARVGAAQAACTCVEAPLEDRLEDADAAFVGEIVRERRTDLRGAPQKLYALEVHQQVKGALPDQVEVRVPPACDIRASGAPPPAEDGSIGLLLARSPDGVWLATTCSVVSPEELVTVGGEPRGGVIKVVLGVAILALVLSWALRRKARGVRPRLPGAPEP